MNDIEIMLDKESGETEFNLVASILADNSLIYNLTVKAEYFVNSTAKSILNAMYEVKNNGDDVNLITVSEALNGKVSLDRLIELMNTGDIYKSSFGSLQDRIVRNYKRRKCADLINEMSKDLIDNVEPDKILGSVYNAMSQDDKVSNNVFSMSDVLIGTLNQIEEAYKRGGDITGMRSGYNVLDKLINGFEKKKYVLIGARPSVGKTAFSLELAKRLSYENKGIYFSVEMDKENLGKRLVANTSYINGYKVNAGKLTEDEFDRVVKASERLSKYKLNVIDKAGITVEEIVRLCTKAKYTDGLDFIVVDYIQLVKTENKNATTEKMKVDEVSGRLRELSKDLDINVIALAQLNRGVESRADKKPTVSDLKETGNLEQDANIILLLHGDDDVIFQSGAEKLNVIIGKNRDGKKKTLCYEYHKETQRIIEKGIEVEREE